jgi:hypothetical protein
MISIPDHLWNRMLAEFSQELRRVEQVCYLDGVVCSHGEIVTTLTIPNAALHPGRFDVSPECMSQAGKHLRAHRLRRIAQVHTHPDAWVGHSPWDDQRAYSQQPGAVSVVLPHYARAHPRLEDAGVHLRTAAGWAQLHPAIVSQHVRIIPSFFDFRPPLEVTHDRARIEPTRRGSWRTLLAILGLPSGRDNG